MTQPIGMLDPPPAPPVIFFSSALLSFIDLLLSVVFAVFLVAVFAFAFVFFYTPGRNVDQVSWIPAIEF